jgi:hypothetical protein
MNIQPLIANIDAEILKLEQAKSVLQGLNTASTPAATGKRGRGRPKGSGTKVVAPVKAKRTMSAEGKERIAAAQKKRWAKAKKSATATA